MTTTMGALGLDAKESGIECMTPLDVLASIHFQWVMHDEGHRAEGQARRPTNVSVPHQTYVQGTRPAHLGVPTMFTTGGHTHRNQVEQFKNSTNDSDGQ
jgi:hypothetical protein